MLEKLVRQLVIHGSQLAPQEIIGLRHGLIPTAPFVLFPTAAQAWVIASNLRHGFLLTGGGRFIHEGVARGER
jgi:hypothetical protein